MLPGLGKQFLPTQNTLVHIIPPIYLLFCMSYSKSVTFIEFLMGFCMYDDMFDIIQITDKNYYILNFQNQVKFYM